MSYMVVCFYAVASFFMGGRLGGFLPFASFFMGDPPMFALRSAVTARRLYSPSGAFGCGGLSGWFFVFLSSLHEVLIPLFPMLSVVFLVLLVFG